LVALHDQYSILTDPIDREAKALEIRNSINVAKTAFQDESLADHTDIQVIKNDLSNIKCSDRIVEVMTDAWLAYIEELENDNLDNNPRLDADIVAISQECSDEYGDTVHLARSIASLQGSQVYYDHNDGCRDTGYSSPRSSINESTILLDVSPNPSNGLFNVDLGYATQGKLTLLSSQGQFMKELVIIDQSELNFESEESGIYFLRFVNKDGQSTIKKLICIK